MDDTLFVALGIVIGMYGPRSIAWLLTRRERRERRIHKMSIQQMLDQMTTERREQVMRMPSQRNSGDPSVRLPK